MAGEAPVGSRYGRLLIAPGAAARPAAGRRRLRADERCAGPVPVRPQPAHRPGADGDRRARRHRHDDDHRLRRHRPLGRIVDRADQRRDRGAAARRLQPDGGDRGRRRDGRAGRRPERPRHHRAAGAAVHRHARHAGRRPRRRQVAGRSADGQRAADVGQRAGGHVPDAGVAARRARRVADAAAGDRDDGGAGADGVRPARLRHRLERGGGARLRRRHQSRQGRRSTAWPACSSGCPA